MLPVAIYGTEFFPVNGEVPPRRPKELPRGVTVRFGSPIQVPKRVDGKRVTAEEATHLIMMRIADLLPGSVSRRLRRHGTKRAKRFWADRDRS